MNIEPQSTAGLPVVNQALEPASVRHGSAATQKAYQSALAFEEVLVEQLSKAMTATLGGGESGQEGGPGSEEGESSSGELSSMLPQALSAGIMNAGGLGLAAQMTSSLENLSPAAQANQAGQPAGSSAAPAASSVAAPVPSSSGGTGSTIPAATGGVSAA
jgi:Rod binding domain-containing protein